MSKSERDSSEGGEGSRYGEELLQANWNPVVALLRRSRDRTAELTRPARSVSDKKAAAFLMRIYNSGA